MLPITVAILAAVALIGFLVNDQRANYRKYHKLWNGGFCECGHEFCQDGMVWSIRGPELYHWICPMCQTYMELPKHLDETMDILFPLQLPIWYQRQRQLEKEAKNDTKQQSLTSRETKFQLFQLQGQNHLAHRVRALAFSPPKKGTP